MNKKGKGKIEVKALEIKTKAKLTKIIKTRKGSLMRFQIVLIRI